MTYINRKADGYPIPCDVCGADPCKTMDFGEDPFNQYNGRYQCRFCADTLLGNVISTRGENQSLAAAIAQAFNILYGKKP